MNYTYARMSDSNVTACVINSFTFSSWIITANFSSVAIVCHQFLTWIAQSYVDLCLTLLLVRKFSAVEEELNEPYHNITSMINPYRWIMVCLVMSLSASFLQKISAATDHLCQIALKQNHAKRNRVKQDLCSMVMDGWQWIVLQLQRLA